jgi:hypothetical protein
LSAIGVAFAFTGIGLAAFVVAIALVRYFFSGA